jgi:tRNA (guanine-N7-)-methyltransferase
VTLPRLALAETLPPDLLARRPLWLEVGFGGGEHALAQVRAHPEATLIACEVFENGICSLLSALVPEGDEARAPLPPNLLLWTDDARLLLRGLPDGCLDRLFLLFPDPWPKARHAKRRFVHPAMLPLLARVLRPGAEWRVASDDPTYQAWVRDVMAPQTLFEIAEPATTRPPGWPPTRYEAKALRAGRQPLYWVFRRTEAPVDAAAVAALAIISGSPEQLP